MLSQNILKSIDSDATMVFQYFGRILSFGIILSVWFVKGCTTNATPSKCEGFRANGCCVGYIWNHTTNKCTQCMSGYSGPNCSIPCPYPTYGDDCQGICDCDNDSCDVSTGCLVQPDDRRLPSVFATDNSTSEPNSSINRTLIQLIKFFCGVDILLICSYSISFAIDRRKHKGRLEIENRISPVPPNHLVYDNIEIIFSPND